MCMYVCVYGTHCTVYLPSFQLKFFESFINTHGSQQQMPDLLRDRVVPELFALIQLPCLPVDFHTTNAASLLGTFLRSLTAVNMHSLAPVTTAETNENGTEMVWNKLLNCLFDVIGGCEQLLHEDVGDLLINADQVPNQGLPQSHLLRDYIEQKGESRLVRKLSVVASILSVIQSMGNQVSREQRRILVRLWNGSRGTKLCSQLR